MHVLQVLTISSLAHRNKHLTNNANVIEVTDSITDILTNSEACSNLPTCQYMVY